MGGRVTFSRRLDYNESAAEPDKRRRATKMKLWQVIMLCMLAIGLAFLGFVYFLGHQANEKLVDATPPGYIFSDNPTTDELNSSLAVTVEPFTSPWSEIATERVVNSDADGLMLEEHNNEESEYESDKNLPMEYRSQTDPPAPYAPWIRYSAGYAPSVSQNIEKTNSITSPYLAYVSVAFTVKNSAYYGSQMEASQAPYITSDTVTRNLVFAFQDDHWVLKEDDQSAGSSAQSSSAPAASTPSPLPATDQQPSQPFTMGTKASGATPPDLTGLGQ
jgi:hypothetical protein